MANGIDMAEYAVNCEAARQNVWRDVPDLTGSPYVLFLGRIHRKKRLDLLLPAFLEGAPEPFKLVVAGPDSEGLWDPLHERFLRGPAARRVVRVGTVSGNEKISLSAGASLFVLCSEHENFGNAALEALAAGTPVLLTPAVDITQMCVAAGIGYEAPLQQRAWSDQFANLLSDPRSLRAVGDRAKEWVAEEFAWEKIAAQLVQRYEALPRALRQKPGSRPKTVEVAC
jgi:glycosyltransferase involved in cell wall biosynthesis